MKKLFFPLITVLILWFSAKAIAENTYCYSEKKETSLIFSCEMPPGKNLLNEGWEECYP